MNPLKKTWIFICLLTPSFLANSAGLDCTKASSIVEKKICADAYLSQLDYELNETFNEANSSYIGIDGDTGARIDPLGKEQQVWLLKIRNNCKDTACLHQVYKDRITEIKFKWPPR